MTEVFVLNGKFVDQNNAVVSAEDRGFQFGDGVYEVIRAYNGKPFCMDRHLSRMKQGLEAIRIPMPLEIKEFEKLCNEALEKSGLKEALIYIQVTRGAAPRQHIPPKGLKPTFVIIVRGTPDIPPELKEQGVKISLSPDIRWHKCYIKTVQLLPNTMAKEEAKEKGAFEAVFFRDGIITEGSSSNIFIVKGGRVFTHPANERILHGITRGVAIEIAEGLGIEVEERAFSPEELLKADEAFLTGTGTEIMPVVQVDDDIIGNGKPGHITKKIMEKFKEITNCL